LWTATCERGIFHTREEVEAWGRKNALQLVEYDPNAGNVLPLFFTRSDMKICIVSSCGGHLTEVRQLAETYAGFDHFYVLNDTVELPDDMRGRTYFIRHSERDWLFMVNLWEAVRILMHERPDVILSTGAGPVVPFALVGRLFFRTRVLFIETATRISQPSMTGRIMYRLAHKFYYQWRPLASHFPRGTYGGVVF
jgi:beta-1,4-N-acetylglucosaminyltransferase